MKAKVVGLISNNDAYGTQHLFEAMKRCNGYAKVVSICDNRYVAVVQGVNLWSKEAVVEFVMTNMVSITCGE